MNKILTIKFGSHLYGTDTPSSDLDYKAIYLPTAKEICLGTYKKTIQTYRPKAEGERNTKDDVDTEILSLDRFITLLLEGQTMALDMLFAKTQNWVQVTSYGQYIMDKIVVNRYNFLNKNVNAFVGYARQQAAKYGQKGFRIHAIRVTLEKLDKMGPFEKFDGLDQDSFTEWVKSTGNEHIKIVYVDGPNDKEGKGCPLKHLNVAGKLYPFSAQVRYIKASLQKRMDEYGRRALMAERNEGIDWKALSHAVRVNSQAIELLRTAHITFPRPDRQLLLDIKQGKLPYKEVAEIIEIGLEQLKLEMANSRLPEKPNYEWAENFVYEIYEGVIADRLMLLERGR